MYNVKPRGYDMQDSLTLFHLTHQILKVITKESIPAIYHALGNSRPIKDLQKKTSYRVIHCPPLMLSTLVFQVELISSLISDRYLLQDGNDWRLPLLQEVEHHQNVSIRREASSGRIPNVAAL